VWADNEQLLDVATRAMNPAMGAKAQASVRIVEGIDVVIEPIMMDTGLSHNARRKTSRRLLFLSVAFAFMAHLSAG
jgi:hypothetical protein